MTRSLPTIIGNFAQGMIHYRDHYPNQEQLARIVLPIIVENKMAVRAIVDTGAPWCIIDPAIVRRTGTATRKGYKLGEKLMIRGMWYEGEIIRMLFSLEAERGENLNVDATVFVPTLPPGVAWPHPNFIGLGGFLDRIRFAVDPSENIFYFGPVDGDPL